MNGVDEGLDAGGIHVRVDPVPEVGDPSDKSFNIFLAGVLNGPKWGGRLLWPDNDFWGNHRMKYFQRIESYLINTIT